MLYGYRRFTVYIKTDDIYKDIAEEVETRFDISNYELDRPLPIGKNKKVIRLLKDELDGKIMTKFSGLRAKTYSYLIDDDSEDKKAKDTKKCVIKRKIKSKKHKYCLQATQLENKIKHLEKNKINIDSLKKNHNEIITNNKSILKAQQRFKNERHNVFTAEIKKTVLISNDDKIIQSKIKQLNIWLWNEQRSKKGKRRDET